MRQYEVASPRMHVGILSMLLVPWETLAAVWSVVLEKMRSVCPSLLVAGLQSLAPLHLIPEGLSMPMTPPGLVWAAFAVSFSAFSLLLHGRQFREQRPVPVVLWLYRRERKEVSVHAGVLLVQ